MQKDQENYLETYAILQELKVLNKDTTGMSVCRVEQNREQFKKYTISKAIQELDEIFDG